MVLYRPIYIFLFIVCSLSLLIAGLPSNLTMGKALFESFQYDESLKYLTEANGSDHSNLEALKKLKQYYLLNGDLAAPIEIQKKLVKLRPKNLRFRQDLETLYAWSNQNYLRLLSMRDRAELLSLEKQEELLLEVAEGLRWMSKIEEAEVVYQRLLDSKDGRIMNAALNFFLGHGQVKKVRLALERLLSQTNFDAEKRAYYAESLELEGEWEEAILQYTRIIAGEEIRWEDFFERLKWQGLSSKHRVYLEHVLSLLFIHHEYGRMDQLYQVIRIRYPDQLEYTFTHVEVLYNLKEFERAHAILPVLEKAQVHRHSVARFYYNMGYKSDALRVYQELIQQYPNDLILATELARLYEELGEKRKALEIWYKVLKRAPKASLDLQWSELYAQNSPLTQVNFKKKTSSKTIDAEEANANISRLHEELGERDQALARALELLNINPNNQEARKRAMRLYLQKRNYDKAYNLIQNTIPDQEVHALSAEIYFSRKEYIKVVESIDLIPFNQRESYIFVMEEEALFYSQQEERYQNFCKRLELERREVPEFYLILAHCYARQDDFSRGREYYRKHFEQTQNHQRELRQEYIYFLLDNNAFAEAKEQILLLEKIAPVDELRRDYIIRFQENRDKRSVRLRVEAQGQQVVDGDLYREKITLSKGLGDGKKIAGIIDRGHSGINSGDLTHAYLMYKRNFLVREYEFESEFKIGEDLRLKKEGTPLFLSLRPILDNKHYINLSAWVTRPEFFSVAQWQAPRAYSSGLSLYSEMERKWNQVVYDQRIGAEWQSLDYAGDTGTQSKADLTILFHLLNWSSLAQISIGPGLSFAKMPSASELLRSIYLNDSLYYFLAVELKLPFGHNQEQEIKLGSRVGADPRRDLGFADSWSSWAEYAWPEGNGLGFRAHMEYSLEGPQNYKGEQFSAMILLDIMPNRRADL